MLLSRGETTFVAGSAALKPHPTRMFVAGFGAAVVIGTALLLLPVAAADGRSSGVLVALFTATSAVSVTGLIVVDTPQHWSAFGEVVILGLIQLGGFGILTTASLLGLLATRRFGLRMQLTAQTERKSLGLGEVRRVMLGVVKISLAFEVVIAVVLTVRLWSRYGISPGRAMYEGIFHGVSAFNGAGFALYSESMSRYVTDAWICLPIAIGVIAGSLGFPVLIELRRELGTPRRWSLHTKITVYTSAILLAIGTISVIVSEWANPRTLGPLGIPGKLLAGFFQGSMPRSGGFNTVDVGAMESDTLLVTDMMMFIGGGSASTAGGIKVTTFALLAFVIWAEVRGQPTVHVMGRRVPAEIQRQALTVALLGVAVMAASTFTLLIVSPFRLDVVLFEVASAFGTVGLSTGITGELPPAGQALIAALMFIGRVGPATLATALALRERVRRYELPEERPIVG